MRGNSHVRFLEGLGARKGPWPTRRRHGKSSWLAKDPHKKATEIEQMSYAEFQEREERAAEEELSSLSQLTTAELVARIEAGRLGKHSQAFQALAAKGEAAVAVPVLYRQLSEPRRSYADRLSCAYALLSLLPYSGIPAHSLVDPSHRGHGIYTQDLEALVRTVLARLGSDSTRR